MILDYDEKTRDLPKKATDINSFVNTKVASTIRKFSSCKNIKIITQSVQDLDIDEETQFVSKMPLSFYTEVSNGIHKFHDFKKKRKGTQSTECSSCDEK